MHGRTSGRVRNDIGPLASAVLGALLLCAAAAAGERLQTVSRGEKDPTELALFPRGAWVRPLAFGFNELVADAAWLRALQYYGEHRISDRRYPYLETLFQTVTDLDPRFVNAYIFGALTLAEDEGQLERGLALLQRGMAANPESWWLVFEYGFLQYIHGNDPDRAGHWLARAARMEDSPPWVRRLAAHASAKSGDRETAIALWLEMYHNSENEEIRRIARDYLARLGHPEFQSQSGTDSEAQVDRSLQPGRRG
jgi:tetratricopeptide (TPR) repeat protein